MDSLSKYSYGPGSKSILGFNLPEFGVSEFYGGNKNSVNNAIAAKSANQKTQNPTLPYGPPLPTNLPKTNDKTSNSTNNSKSGTSSSSSKSAIQAQLDKEKQQKQAEYNAQLATLNSTYDNTAKTLRSNLDSLGRQRENSLASLDLGYQNFQGDINSQRTRAQQDYERNVADAQSSSQSVQRANRNTLRALGILGSTAAADMLARPIEQFDKTRGTLVQAKEQRIQDLENALNQKTQEHLLAKKSLEDQFVSLVDKIRNDLAFNDRQKASAIQQAQLALNDNINKIALQQLAYEQQAQLAAQSYADLPDYNPISLDTSGIYNSALFAPENRDQQNASIYDSSLADPYGLFTRKDQQQNSLSGL